MVVVELVPLRGGNDRIWDTPVKQDSDTVSIPNFFLQTPPSLLQGSTPGLNPRRGTNPALRVQGPVGNYLKWSCTRG